MKLRYIAALVLCMAGAACSSIVPSDARMASQIVGQFDREFGVEFVQVDHLMRIRGGQNSHGRYIADVQYDLRFTKGLSQVKREVGSAQAMELSAMFGDFHAGDTKHIANMVIFEKKAKGWVLIKREREN